MRRFESSVPSVGEASASPPASTPTKRAPSHPAAPVTSVTGGVKAINRRSRPRQSQTPDPRCFKMGPPCAVRRLATRSAVMAARRTAGFTNVWRIHPGRPNRVGEIVMAAGATPQSRPTNTSGEPKAFDAPPLGATDGERFLIACSLE